MLEVRPLAATGWWPPQAPSGDNAPALAGAGSLARAVAGWARREGARLAVQAPGGTLTFGELDAAANRLAHAILERRGEAEEPAGVLLPHDWSMVAALLATMKAGKLQVPLDPRDPAARMTQILADADPPLVLTDAAHRAQAEALAPGASVLVLEEALAGGRDDDPGLSFAPERGTGLIYTSGSTGRPKASVSVCRGGAHVSRQAALIDGLGPADRQSALLPASYGAGLTLHLALANGAAICMYDLIGGGPDGLAAWIERAEITVLRISAAGYRTLLRLLPDGRRLPARVRLVETNAERLQASDVELHLRRGAEGGRLSQIYGTTEAGILARLEVGPEHAAGAAGEFLPIGRPYPEVQVQIVGGDGRALPPGEAGELLVTGPCLALGYWRNPELTAARFGVDRDGVRFYRTGDVVRLRPDGALDYLGRLGDRARVRGRTVETLEVEQALRSLAPVADAAVVAVPLPDGGDRLAAYIVPTAGVQPTVRDLRLGLQPLVPDFMVPATFALLTELPRALGGKVDRRALREATPAPRSSAYRAPRGDFELDLAVIWQEVLGVPRVGGLDDFFELGGDSVLAVELAVAVEERFGQSLGVDALLQAPTLGALAAVLARGRLPAAGGPLVTLQAEGSGTPLFCLPGAGGTALAWRGLAARLGTDRPVHVVEARGLHRRGLPDRSIEGGARSACAAIRALQPNGPYLLAGHSLGGLMAYELAVQLQRAGEEIALVIVLDTPAPGLPLRPRGPRTPPLLARVRRDLRAGGLGGVAAGGGRVLGRAWQRAVNPVRMAVAGLLPFPRGIQYGVFGELGAVAAARYLRRAAARCPAPLLVVRATGSEVGTDDLGWGAVAAGPVATAAVPGDHTSLLREPEVAELARCVAPALRAAAPARGA